MFAESDLLPISALQHWLYCPRQCALIHLERQWGDNRFTVLGRQLHAKAHDPRRHEATPGVRVVRGMPVRSLRLGLAGVCDVVEFPADGRGPPLPVEYKRGRPKRGDMDRVQVAAQAMCLEEMLGGARTIPEARLFYGRTRRRVAVLLDASLRAAVEQAAGELRAMLDSGRTPAATYEPGRCDPCSLLPLCQPAAMRVRSGTAGRFRALLEQTLKDGDTRGGPVPAAGTG